MASFNQGVKDTNDPSYINSSKELTSRDFPTTAQDIYRTDKQNFLESLFTGVKGAIDTADNFVKDNIKEAVYEGVDPIRDAQGVGEEVARVTAEAGDAYNNPLAANKPPNPSLYQSNIARLQAAYDQGKITDRNYYAQLETLTRSIRSRFPGYREEVDAMVHSVTGITPANALRASIENELSRNAAAKGEVDKDFNRFLINKAEFLPADYYERKAKGNPYGQEETIAYVANQEQKEHAVKTQSANLDLAIKEGKYTEEQAQQVAQEKASHVSVTVQAEIAPLLKQVADMEKAGQHPTPEQEAALRAELIRLKSMTQFALDKEFTSPLAPGSSRTLDGVIDKSKKEAIYKDSLRSIETLEQALTDKNYGLFNTRLNEINAIQSSTKLDILRKYPSLAAMEEVSKALGPGGAKILEQLSDVPQTGIKQSLTTEMQHLFKSIQANNMTGGKFTPSGKTSVDQQLKDIQEMPGGKTPAATKAYLNSWQSVLMSPEVPAKNKAEAAKILFADDNTRFLEKFVPGDRMQVFRQLTSPQITKEMIKVKDTDPKAFENYSKWSMNAFATVMKSTAEQVGKAPDARYWSIQFNPSAARYELSPTPEGIRVLNSRSGGIRGGMSVIDGLARLTGESNLQETVERLNNGIATIKPILEANGFKAGEEVPKLVNSMTHYDEKNRTIWQWLLQKAEPSGKPEDQTFGGVHPNFTQASGANNSRGLLSLTEDSFVDARVKETAKSYYTKGMAILEGEGKMPTHIAQGFMANFKVESGFADDVISGRRRGDSGQAVGVAQWHPDRQARFAKAFGKPLSQASYEEQIRFVIYELNNMESAAKEKIMKARNAAEAAALVDEYYERSSGEHRDKRVKAAMAYAAND